MSAQFAAGQEDDTGTELLADGPGRRLRARRQAQGLELDQVADQLRLSPEVIESLERDDYETLPAQVFVIGYIRKYARLVGLDPEPLLAAHEATAPRPKSPQLGAAPRAAPQIGSGNLVTRSVGAGILVLLVASTFLWWQSQRPATEAPTADAGEEHQPESTTMPELAPEYQAPPDAGSDRLEMPTSGPPAAPASEILTSVSELQSTSPATEQQPAIDVTATTTDQETDQATPASSEGDTGAAEAGEEAEKEAAATASTEVVLSFDGPCWVDVRDSEREYKLFGEMKKGDRHVLGGKPPYSLILGNAAATQITVGGEPFDLSGKSRGNVARFTLTPGQTQ